MKSKYYLYKETHSSLHMDTWHRDLMEQPYKYKVYWKFDDPYVILMKKKRVTVDSTVLCTLKDDGRAFTCLL